MTLRDRLLAKVRVNEDTSCWNWTASRNSSGYGQIKHNGTPRKANRVSYELHCGDIPEGMFVCHRCDNRACINPDHLFLGTNADNMADRNAKGRQARGETAGRSKLSKADVVAIRTTAGISRREIAKRYGVSQRQITGIRSGKSWAHLQDAVTEGFRAESVVENSTST